MTETLAGLPFWQLRFDAEGDPEGSVDYAVDEISSRGVTDLIIFSHGWNNSPDTARRLYAAWFGQLAPQLSHATAAREIRVGLVGVLWPSQRWSDEPIPDFEPAAATPSTDAAAAVPQPTVDAGPPTLDDVIGELRTGFPNGVSELDAMADLLAHEPSAAAVAEFMHELQAFAKATAVDHDDGEAADAVSTQSAPRMLSDEPRELFGRYTAQLRGSGENVTEMAGGAAGLGDPLQGIWHGAKEALRQVTYWQMKNRAGVVGQHGLGPFVGSLQQASPNIHVHLVGHSFGARVVSYALAGLPVRLVPSPVKSVTLLQGAFSHFAFAAPLPFDASRSGGLAGKLTMIDGPLTVCFSTHDDAVGKFYPLASIVAGEDAAAAQDRFYRWGGMGHDGAQGVGARLGDLQPADSTAVYQFEKSKVMNIDVSQIVCRGGPPSGAHSDIVHPELTWVVLKAGKIVA